MSRLACLILNTWFSILFIFIKADTINTVLIWWNRTVIEVSTCTWIWDCWTNSGLAFIFIVALLAIHQFSLASKCLVWTKLCCWVTYIQKILSKICQIFICYSYTIIAKVIWNYWAYLKLWAQSTLTLLIR